MSELAIHTRTEVFGPSANVPLNSTGSPRPKMAAGARWLTVHHTGSGSGWIDLGDTPAELHALQAYAVGAKKPWEYNWVVDSAGEIWELAGDYVAAHSDGENTEAIGVLLLLNSTVEAPTDQMIEGVRALRDLRLVPQGRLAADFEQLPHQQMPGAATACPGPKVMARWAEFLQPSQALKPAIPDPPVQPPAPIPMEDDMSDLTLLDCADKTARQGVLIVAGGRIIALKDPNELAAVQRTFAPKVNTAPTADDFDTVVAVLSR